MACSSDSASRAKITEAMPSEAPGRLSSQPATSLVGRVFLCRSRFQSLAEIQQQIKSRSGRVVISTISKALKRLESDVVVDRTADGFRLRQGDKLLEKLAESYKPPKVTKTVTLSTKEPLADLLRLAPRNSPLVLSGPSSIAAYAVMGRSDRPVLYTPSIDSLLRKWGKKVEVTSRFVDLELRQTDDPTVYFDTRIQNDLPYASPVQVFLECLVGDKRERETALKVQERILKDLQP
jgi:hypothetical protein